MRPGSPHGSDAERPLEGRTVLITRAAGEGAGLAAAVRQRGGEPWEVPVIAIAGPPDPAALAAAARRAGDYAWLVFTSRHGVQHFLAAVEAAGTGRGALARARVVAVGPATARAIREAGVTAAVRTPATADAAGVLDLLLREVRPGERVLVVRPLEAALDVAERLRAAGVAADEVVAYRTVAAHAPGALEPVLRARRVDYVTFTSGSTVRRLLEAAGGPGVLAGARIACIGPRTAEAARAAGLEVHVVARETTAEALAEAVAADAAERRRAPGR